MDELKRTLNDVESAFQAAERLAWDDRRQRGVYQKVMMTGPGGFPTPPEGLPKGALIETIANPVELTERRSDQMPVIYIALTREEYPSIFELVDEMAWLRQRIK